MITSDSDILHEELSKLKTNLTCRGYKSQLIDLMFNKTTKFTQTEVLEYSSHVNCCK